MLGNEGDQQEKDCYNGDEDASRNHRHVETRPHANTRYQTTRTSQEDMAPTDQGRHDGRG